MSIRLDPRRLSALKLLAAEAGMRPGELVTSWVEERLDAARAGKAQAPAPGVTRADLERMAQRVEENRRLIEQLLAARAAGEAPSEAPAPRRRGRPPKAAAPGAPGTAPTPEAPAGARIPLHEEITDVIRERGPLSASEIATAIHERGRYSAPRSSKPLDAATVNSRVSNPAYRDRFARADGRIGLAEKAGSQE